MALDPVQAMPGRKLLHPRAPQKRMHWQGLRLLDHTVHDASNEWLDEGRDVEEQHSHAHVLLAYTQPLKHGVP